MCLGECAHDDDVGVRLDERDRAAHAGLGRKVDIGLVDDDHDVVGYGRDEGGDLLKGQGRAGRVVRRAEDDGDSVRGDGLAHPDEVVATIREERHGGGLTANGRHGDWVGLEGTPWEDHPGAGLTDGGQSGHKNRRGASAHAYLVGADPEALAECLPQGGSRQVGVAVDRLQLARDRFQHRGAGRGRHFVG